MKKRRIWSANRKKNRNSDLGSSVNIESDTTMMSNRTLEEPLIPVERNLTIKEAEIDSITASGNSTEKRVRKNNETQVTYSEYNRTVAKSVTKELKEQYVTNGSSNMSNIHNHLKINELNRQLKTFLHNKFGVSAALETRWRSGSAKQRISRLRPAFTAQDGESFQDIMKISKMIIKIYYVLIICKRLINELNIRK